MDFKEFLAAITGDWVALMSGIASVILTIIGVAKKWEQVPRWTFWVAAVMCFFFASARIWTTEHRARLLAEKRLEEMTIPKLSCKFAGLQTGQLNRGKDKNTLVVVSGIINNRGGPTVLNIWEMGMRFKDGSFVNGQTMLQLSDQGRLDLGKGVGLDAKDWWPSKAESNPIVTGGAAAGWVYFLFPKMSQDQLWDRTPVAVVLKVVDVTGKQWTFEEQVLGTRMSPCRPASANVWASSIARMSSHNPKLQTLKIG